jgi:hypothetical protein
MAMMGRSGFALLLGVAAACGDPSPSRSDAAVDGDDAAIFLDAMEQTARRVDILFVIDDGPSMLDKQTTLMNNLPNLMNTLQTMPGGLPNVHIGVITPDLGTRGALDASPGSPIGSGPGACVNNGKAGMLRTHASVNGRYIVDVALADGNRQRNYTGTLSEAFSHLAAVGVQGCGFEQPLEAAKLALSPETTANAGFLRPDAKLVIIIIDDEDDCSVAHASFFTTDTTTLGPLLSFRCNRFGHVCATGGTDSNEMNQVGSKAGCMSNEASTYLTHVADYVTFFRGLKTDPTNVIVGAVVAPATPYDVELRTPAGGGTAVPAVAHSCLYNGASGPEVGDPAVRLLEFTNGFPNRAASQTICAQDYAMAFTQITQLLSTLWM